MALGRWLLVPVLLRVAVGGACPKGFGQKGFFPQEWKIPEWPDMNQESAANLRTVTLGGFRKESLNEEYLEGPTSEFRMQGRETYWQASGEYFLYFCLNFQKWRIAGISAFGQNAAGNCLAFVSDLYPGRDIRNASLIKGWIEVQDGEWVVRQEAGVVSLGNLGEQMGGEGDGAAGSEEALDPDSPECKQAADDASAPGGSGLAQPRQSKCPVKRAARAVGEAVVKAGKWIRRLFPALLGAPPEEQAAGDGAAAAPEGRGSEL